MLFFYDPETGQHVYRPSLTTPTHTDSVNTPRHTRDSNRPSFIPDRSSQNFRETRHSGQSSSGSFSNSFLDDEPKRSSTPDLGWGETGGFLVERKGTNHRQTQPRPSFIGRVQVEKAHERKEQQVREQRLREEKLRREKTAQRQRAKEESSGSGHDFEPAKQQQPGASSPRLDLPPSIVVTQYEENEPKTKEERTAYNKGRSSASSQAVIIPS
ncbi:hypothetical protein LTR17_000054 [Elasticomyces elasticus]|nr:hypothetical protein LTR17_000054 [Elasticomyces elasticus]